MLNWYNLYKFARRNENDMLALEIYRKILIAVRNNTGEDYKETINVDDSCNLFLRLIKVPDSNNMLRYDAFDIGGDTITPEEDFEHRTFDPYIKIDLGIKS